MRSKVKVDKFIAKDIIITRLFFSNNSRISIDLIPNYDQCTIGGCHAEFSRLVEPNWQRFEGRFIGHVVHQDYTVDIAVEFVSDIFVIWITWMDRASKVKVITIPS